MKKLTLLCLLFLSPTLFAQQTPRVQAFKKSLIPFEAMGQVVRGFQSYRKDDFLKKAQSFKQLAPLPFNHFNDPKSAAGTRALPKIWSQPSEFNRLKTEYLRRTVALEQAALKYDLAQVKIAYGQVASSCKSCHDSFRDPKPID